MSLGTIYIFYNFLCFSYHNPTLIETKIGFLSGKLQQGCQIGLLSFHGRIAKENTCLEQIRSFFWKFRKLSEKVLTSANKTLLGLSKLDSTCPWEHFEAKKLFLKTVQFSKKVRTLRKTISAFSRKKMVAVDRTPPYFPIGTLGSKIFSWEELFFLNNFQHWVESFGFLPKGIAGCQNSILRLHGTS